MQKPQIISIHYYFRRQTALRFSTCLCLSFSPKWLPNFIESKHWHQFHGHMLNALEKCREQIDRDERHIHRNMHSNFASGAWLETLTHTHTHWLFFIHFVNACRTHTLTRRDTCNAPKIFARHFCNYNSCSDDKLILFFLSWLIAHNYSLLIFSTGSCENASRFSIYFLFRFFDWFFLSAIHCTALRLRFDRTIYDLRIVVCTMVPKQVEKPQKTMKWGNTSIWKLIPWNWEKHKQ